MKITGSQIGAMSEISLGKVKKVAPNSAPVTAQHTDQLELSSEARTLDAVRQLVGDLPEVREEKIEALRREIQGGRYHPSAEKIADNILAEMRLARRNRS